MNHSAATATETHPTYGFTLTAGSLAIRLGYKVAGNIVNLFATTQIGHNKPQVWRQFSAPRQNAVEAAHKLVLDALEYADATNALVRPSEDLSLDDFIEHMSLTLNGELH